MKRKEENSLYNKKILLSIKEIMDMTGFGEKKVRQILNDPKSTFTVKNGNRLYAHRELLEEHLRKCAKLHLTI